MPLEERQAQEIELEVRRLASGGYSVQFDGHARYSMQQHGVTRQEVVHVLRNGALDRQDVRHAAHADETRYSMLGATLDGDRRLRVVFALRKEAILPDRIVHVITAYED